MPFSEVELEKGNQNGEVKPFSEVELEKGNQKWKVSPFQRSMEKGNQNEK